MSIYTRNFPNNLKIRIVLNILNTIIRQRFDRNISFFEKNLHYSSLNHHLPTLNYFPSIFNCISIVE